MQIFNRTWHICNNNNHEDNDDDDEEDKQLRNEAYVSIAAGRSCSGKEENAGDITKSNRVYEELEICSKIVFA